jgi:hypothetical protein
MAKWLFRGIATGLRHFCETLLYSLNYRCTKNVACPFASMECLGVYRHGMACPATTLLFGRCSRNQLIRQIEFLKAENEMLRKRIPIKHISSRMSGSDSSTLA